MTGDQGAVYREDGAALFQGVLPREALVAVAQAIEDALERPPSTAVEYVGSDRPGRFFNASFLARTDPVIREFTRRSELLELAAELLGARRVGLFFDQLLVKEPGTAANMPWHQDLPYWPVDPPAALVTLWIPFDPVDRTSGTVLYARGSHRWPETSRRWQLPRPSGEAAPELIEPAAVMVDPSFVYWELEPGDVIAHHPLSVHGSPGNLSADTRRRALALRYFSDECRYHYRPKHILENPKIQAMLPPLSFAEGDPIESEAFPIIYEV